MTAEAALFEQRTDPGAPNRSAAAPLSAAETARGSADKRTAQEQHAYARHDGSQ